MHLALRRNCSNMRRIKYFLQPSTRVNKLPENITYDLNFPDAYDRCLFLQVRVNVRRFTFSFNQPLVRVGTLTWQSVWSVIQVNGCVIYQNSWQESWVQNCLKNQQTEGKMLAYCLQHSWQKEWIRPWHSKECLLLVTLILCIRNDWFPALPLPHVRQTYLFV